jgi:hypothetical protein
MPGKSIGIIMNAGYPGNVSRSVDAIIHNREVKLADELSIEFGAPAVLNNDNTYSRFGAANVAVDFAGIAVREVKQTADYFTSEGEYLPGQPCDVIERGSVTVFCAEGTPLSGGKVYVVTVAGTYVAVGDLVATATPAGVGCTTIELTNCRWTTGVMDSDRVAEMTILSRNNA